MLDYIIKMRIRCEEYVLQLNDGCITLLHIKKYDISGVIDNGAKKGEEIGSW